MSYTVSFLLLILLIVVPGLLFKRFYFQGEFSKQFSTKDPVYKSVFYSIVPGIIIQLIAYTIYIFSRNPSFENDDIILIFKELLSIDKSYSNLTITFIQKGINLFLLHQVNVFVLAVIFGFVLYHLIRFFKIDVKLKIFRFKNQWYYIFSGEFKSFKKISKAIEIFNESKNNPNRPTHENQYKYYPVKADILVKENNQNNFYSGYIIDYDLDANNISELDKIYLFSAVRYRKTKEDDYQRNDVEIKNNTTLIPIEGDVFLIDAHNILNLNLTFIPYRKKNKGHKKNNRVFEFLEKLYTLVIFIFLVCFWCDIPFISRLLIALTISQFLSIFIPLKIKTESEQEESISIVYEYDKKIIFIRIGLFVVFFFLLDYFYLKNHFQLLSILSLFKDLI